MLDTDSPIHIIECLLSVKAVPLLFISGRVLAISSAKQGKSGSIFNLVKMIPLLFKKASFSAFTYVLG